MPDRRGAILTNAQLPMQPTACTDSPRQPITENPPPNEVREQDPSGKFISIYNSSSFLLPSSSSFLFPSELGISFNEGNHTLIPINHVHKLGNEFHRNYSQIPH